MISTRRSTKRSRSLKFFAAEGVAAVITPSGIPEAVRVSGYYDQKWHAPFPSFVFSREHYGRIVRMLDKKVPVKLSLERQGHVHRERSRLQRRRRDSGLRSGARAIRWSCSAAISIRGTRQRAPRTTAPAARSAMEAVRMLQALGLSRAERCGWRCGPERSRTISGRWAMSSKHFGKVRMASQRPAGVLAARGVLQSRQRQRADSRRSTCRATRPRAPSSRRG